jgi:hypothetical protein
VNDASLIAPDQLNLWEVSLLDNLSLYSLQPDHFILAAVFFDVEQTNTWSPLTLRVNALSDEWGTGLIPERNIFTAYVSTAPIPEPSTFLLIGGGLALLRLRRRRAS